MIIRSSINFPTVICLPAVCYFSREKPLVKSTALGLFFIIFLSDLLFASFIFRSINPKTQKYLAAIYCYLFYLAFPWDLFIQYTTILSIFLPVRDWQPLCYVGLQVFVLCAGTVHVVLRGYPTGSITLVSSLREIPIVDVLHHPFLFGEIPA